MEFGMGVIDSLSSSFVKYYRRRSYALRHSFFFQKFLFNFFLNYFPSHSTQKVLFTFFSLKFNFSEKVAEAIVLVKNLEKKNGNKSF